MEISQFFMNGDIKGAIAYMREHEEFKDILPAYVAIFENSKYRRFDVPDKLNEILLLYQIYYRDTFYCGLPEAGAAEKLLAGLKALLGMPDAEETLLAERLQAVFEAEGYHALFGKTQGYYGPYVWRETVPTIYQVGLPGGTAEYDFESERFLVSLLKHEAQHTVDMKQFPGITPAELEYRAKLVELHYSGNLGLLQKFLSEADESRTGDSHAMASARIKREFADTDQRSLPCVQARALELLHAHTAEMEEKYGKQKAVSGG